MEDGISTGVEDAGPNGGDGDGDGIRDSTQPHVSTLMTANGNGWVTLVSGCELSDVGVLLESDLEPNPLAFPYGLVEFRLPCPTAEMTVLFHAASALWRLQM